MAQRGTTRRIPITEVTLEATPTTYPHPSIPPSLRHPPTHPSTHPSVPMAAPSVYSTRYSYVDCALHMLLDQVHVYTTIPRPMLDGGGLPLLRITHPLIPSSTRRRTL